jgi:S1-C subfamily serine protease
MENRKPLIIAGVAVAIVLATIWGACLGGSVIYFLMRDDGREVSDRGPRVIVERQPRTERFFEFDSVEVGSGAVIVEVLPGTAADEAGLEAGHIILSVDGTKVDEEHDLADLVGNYEPGDRVNLTVAWPGQEPKEVLVVLDRNPDGGQRPYLGVRYSTHMSADGSSRRVIPPGEWSRPGRPFVIPDTGHLEGVFIMDVTEGSAADNVGLQPGDLILAVDGDEVDEPDELVDAISRFKPGDRVTLTVYQKGDEREVLVKLGQHPDKPGQAHLGVTVGLVSIDGPPGHEVMPGLEFFHEFPHLPGDGHREGGPFDWEEFEHQFEQEFEFEMPHSDGA